MFRFVAPVVGLLALVACSVGRPLYTPELDPERRAEPIVGGKGFVAPGVDELAPPISLTASDGSGLRLLAVEAKAEVDDPFATTEMELRFRNPDPRVIEGKFELALPPGASITGFAMMVGSEWQEAAIVERQKGREVYETFLHQQRDPALLEQEVGNRFSVRVFPIAASGEARLRVTFVQTFEEPTVPYRLALRGLPRVGELDARVGVRDPETGELAWTERHLEQQRPLEDLVVARRGHAARAWRTGRRVIARIPVPNVEHEAKPPRSIAILFDTSASRSVDFVNKIEQLREIVQQLAVRLDPATSLVVLPFDQSVGEPAYHGSISDFADSDASSRLARRRALGASNLERALREVAAVKAERVVIVTDGMITAGEREVAGLVPTLRSIASAGTHRIDVVAAQDRRDDGVLQTLVTSELPEAGVVIDAGRSPEDIALRLSRPTARPVDLAIAGAKRVWPTTLRGVQPGDAVLVYAELDRTTKVLDVTLDAEGAEPEHLRIPVVPSSTKALAQAWVRADVERQLAAAGDVRDAALRKRLAELSVEHGVLNELTALLVLETDQDYARFGIERPTGDPSDVVEPEAASSDAPPPAAAPEPVRTEPTQVGRTLTKTELRKIPIGDSTSRDFTQAIEEAANLSDENAYASEAESARSMAVSDGPKDARRDRARRPARAPKLATVALRSTRVRGDLDRDNAAAHGEILRYDVERCWLASGGGHRNGVITVDLHVGADGIVDRIDLVHARPIASQAFRRCLDRGLRATQFERTGSGGRVRYRFGLEEGFVIAPQAGPTDEVVEQLEDPDRFRTDEGAYAGPFADVKRLLQSGRTEEAAKVAWAWRRSAPDDVMALVAVGEVEQARGHSALAARAFGSIAELHPSDAAMLRFAASRLETIGRAGLPLAIDILRQAQRQRPDHPSSHRALAWALAKHGRFDEAFSALARGFDNAYPDGRFASAREELGQELRILAAAWLRKAPKQRSVIEGRLADLGLTAADRPSLRFVLTWETDTNDVDLHIQDGRGDRAWFSQPTLASGGSLLADVTTGFGPESFVIDGEADAYPYFVAVHYYARGPMGYGMGNVHVIHHDGAGNLDIETLPFVAMKDGAKLLVGAIHRQR